MPEGEDAGDAAECGCVGMVEEKDVNIVSNYNIITSCDDKLAPYVLVNLYAISRNLPDDKVDFYILHHRISEANLNNMNKLCEHFDNVDFHEIYIEDVEAFIELARYGGGWAYEAYFPMCAHEYLPDDVTRALYLDAGDTLVLGDISGYYNKDFEGKSLIVTPSRFKIVGNEKQVFDSDDLGNAEFLLGMLRGLFNSGSYMINLDKLRKAGLTTNDYIALVNELRRLLGDDVEKIYYGDQGLIGVAFVGDICYSEYPEEKNIWHMPYNYCLWYYDRMSERPAYEPKILHFAGTAFKPWEYIYPIDLSVIPLIDKGHSLKELKLGQVEYFYLWHEYALMVERLIGEVDVNTY